jgi:hypothetical protein
MLKSLYDIFQLSKTDIYKRGAKEQDEDEYEFPHIERIIHKHPRGSRVSDISRMPQAALE